MEILSEYGIMIAKPNQQIVLAEPDISPIIIPPLTTKEKVFNVLRIIGIVFLCIIGVALAGVAILGVIWKPWLIIFFFAGLLVGR